MDFMMMSSKKKGKNHKIKRSDTSSSLKVVYISSPMKVKTSAAKFRTIVQQLTGRDSDISVYMLDGRTSSNPDFEILPETFIGSSNHHNHNMIDHQHQLMDINNPISSCRESPTSSNSLLEQTTTTTTTNTTTTASSSCSFPYGGDLLLNSYEIGEEHYLNHSDFFPTNLFGDSNFQLDMDVLGSYDAL